VREVDIASDLGSHFAKDLAHLEVVLGRLRTASEFGFLFELFLRLELSLSQNAPWS